VSRAVAGLEDRAWNAARGKTFSRFSLDFVNRVVAIAEEKAIIQTRPWRGDAWM
jgi:hypothetical protein